MFTVSNIVSHCKAQPYVRDAKHQGVLSGKNVALSVGDGALVVGLAAIGALALTGIMPIGFSCIGWAFVGAGSIIVVVNVTTAIILVKKNPADKKIVVNGEYIVEDSLKKTLKADYDGMREAVIHVRVNQDDTLSYISKESALNTDYSCTITFRVDSKDNYYIKLTHVNIEAAGLEEFKKMFHERFAA